MLDSVPLYDAVATMVTVTLIRSALRGLFEVVEPVVEQEMRAALSGCDDYAEVAKPQIDWDDPDAREALVASRARDGYAALAVLHGRELAEPIAQAAALLATVLGQDLDPGSDGVFRVARRVARDRVISTVDPDARHGPKTSARGFDGYKGHPAIDPDSEIITATTVTPGNTGDAAAAADLITDLLHDTADTGDTADTADTADTGVRGPVVCGDAAYGTGEFHERLGGAGIESRCKTRRRPRRVGCSARTDSRSISTRRAPPARPESLPRSVRRGAARRGDGSGIAHFATACAGCPLRAGLPAAGAVQHRQVRAHGRYRRARTGPR